VDAQTIWTLAALVALGVFTTTPSVLAFAGLAYSDMTTACMQCAAILAFVFWLERPSRLRTAMFGSSHRPGARVEVDFSDFSCIGSSPNRDLPLVSRDPSIEGKRNRGLVVKDLRGFGISDFGLVGHLWFPSRPNPRKHGPLRGFHAVVPALSEVRRHHGAGVHYQRLCIARSSACSWHNRGVDPKQKRATSVSTRQHSERWLVVLLSGGNCD
jgi:hypothetical protein